MLATILKTPVADSISMKIIDAFVYMRYISNDLIKNNDILVNHEIRILKLEESFNKLSSKQDSIILKIRSMMLFQFYLIYLIMRKKK